METTHHDIQLGQWYITHNQMVYVHDRLIKGQTGNLNTTIPLPSGLDVVCGWNCNVLKKGTCAHKQPFVRVSYSGGSAPMVSYLVTVLDIAVNKVEGTLFTTSTQQVTSRSISNIIYLDGLKDANWGNPKLWEYENSIIDKLTTHVVSKMREKVGASTALAEVIQANNQRSTQLFLGLLGKMARDDASVGDAVFNGVDPFSNRGTFLAHLGGATNNYNSYTTYAARETAFMNSLVLKAARAKYPKDVEKILECYKKVEHARSMEEKPYDWDIEHVTKVLQSKKRTKPADKAEVTELPF